MVHNQIQEQRHLIFDLMRRLLWNQTQLANAVGVTQQSISLWLTGSRPIAKPVRLWIESTNAILDVLEHAGHRHMFVLVERNPFGLPIQVAYTSAQILEHYGQAMLIRLAYRDIANISTGA